MSRNSLYSLSLFLSLQCIQGYQIELDAEVKQAACGFTCTLVFYKKGIQVHDDSMGCIFQCLECTSVNFIKLMCLDS
jgi:hypothetical protein